MKTKVVTLDAKDAGEIELSDDIFGLGGTLGETVGLGSGDPLAIVGVGVNADWPALEFPRELATTMTSLREASGGRPVDGPAALTKALLARDDQFVQAMTQKLMMYALGRELEHYDMPQVRAIVRAAKRQDYRFSALVAGIVESDAFRRQAAAPHGESANSGSAQASLGGAGK